MTDFYKNFEKLTITQLHELLKNSKDRAETLFYQRLINLKMGLEQENVVGKKLL